jgi:protein gp37
MTKIQWTDETWNPFAGCSIVSPGCKNCYAMRDAYRKGFNPLTPHYREITRRVNGHAVWSGKLALAPERILTKPLDWRRPRRVFVNSMSDLFHEDAPAAWIDRVFAIMAASSQHVFQALTKRPERMRDYCRARQGEPLSNLWLGVSVERQQEADERIPDLLATPAAVRFVSAEPLLGPIDLTEMARLDWIIVGGESGPGARRFDPEWARNLLRQRRNAGVAFFVKQMGAEPDGLDLRDRKGGDMMEWPPDLRVREFPQPARRADLFEVAVG